MKCLACVSEGKRSWPLYPEDFATRGIERQGYVWIDDCFCDVCDGELETEKKDNLALNYWLSIQATETKEETTLKYPTKEQYPEGFDWFAIDEDGRAFWSKQRPFYKLSDTTWNCGFDWERALDFDVAPCANWKETLRNKNDELKPEAYKPNYYTWHSKVSCKEVSQEFMSNLGQAIQYIWRSNTLKTTKGQTKEELIKDLEKAQDFIGFEIERLKEGK